MINLIKTKSQNTHHMLAESLSTLPNTLATNYLISSSSYLSSSCISLIDLFLPSASLNTSSTLSKTYTK